MKNNMNECKLKFNFCYITCSNFKEKELLIMRNCIGGSRLGKNVFFNTYATITFNENDKRHEFPIISKLDNFNRSRTNGIIFNIVGNELFDTCIVYQSTSKNDNSYGYLMYNSQTGYTSHKYNIFYDLSDLIQKMFYTLTYTKDALEMFERNYTKMTNGIRTFKRRKCFPNTMPADRAGQPLDSIVWVD